MVEDIADGVTPEDLAALRQIVTRLPELREMAESIGAECVAAILEQAATLAATLVAAARSTELH